MLIQRSNDLIRRIAAIEGLRANANKATAFRTRADTLDAPAHRLASLAEMWPVCQDLGIPLALDDALADRVRAIGRHAQALAEAYQGSAESITLEKANLRFQFWEPLTELPDHVEAALRMAWEQFVSQSLPTVQEQVLQVLQNLPGFNSQVIIIRSLQTKAQLLKSTLPPAAASLPARIAEVRSIAQNLSEAWRSLQGDGIPPEVLTFLQAASGGRATLRQLTPTVVQWIDGYSLKESFRISL
ncbi:MAG: hypothetical protein EXR82_07105 [Gammaproteobacteria bacterium]|nr:hypothetical protein [Gammaproteobacteria bacterium]